MSRILYFSAMITNIVAILILSFMAVAVVNRPEEIMILLLCLLPPVLSVMSIYGLPDMEERKLQRAVNKAQLKKELEKLSK